METLSISVVFKVFWNSILYMIVNIILFFVTRLKTIFETLNTKSLPLTKTIQKQIKIIPNSFIAPPLKYYPQTPQRRRGGVGWEIKICCVNVNGDLAAAITHCEASVAKNVTA